MDSPIDTYLKKQADMPAVDRFSRKHDAEDFAAGQIKYQQLIPKEGPGPNQQYAFEVDLDACTGCKGCVTACHAENGLDEDETWRTVGFVQGGTTEDPAIQHITSACHHCADPGCLNGCPTLAYEKDPVTGIVKHLDDQCFGCQYCILKCPYNVPKYSPSRGIVHKCDMCISRLNVGEAPACVRSCPNEAIKITLVDTQDVLKNSQDYVNVPDAPSSDYTYPTTKYLTQRKFPKQMESVDHYDVQPEHSHLPLVVMLVLTQLSVGVFMAEFSFKNLLNLNLAHAFYAFHTVFALGVGLFALASSLFHLGRPHLAFRAILGIRTSWLSREILVFGLFAKLAIVYAACAWWKPLETLVAHIVPGQNTLQVVGLSVIGVGLLGIYCSVMVYRDTKRPFWDDSTTTFKFYFTSIILGASAMLLTSSFLCVLFPDKLDAYISNNIGHHFAQVIVMASSLKLLLEASVLKHLLPKGDDFLARTAILMTGPLRNFTILRFSCGAFGGLLLPLVMLRIEHTPTLVLTASIATLIFITNLLGELAERYLFFKAVVPLRMPGSGSHVG